MAGIIFLAGGNQDFDLPGKMAALLAEDSYCQRFYVILATAATSSPSLKFIIRTPWMPGPAPAPHGRISPAPEAY